MTTTEMYDAMRWSAAEKAELRAKFPRLYADVERGSAWSMDHVSCGRGWRALIQRVFMIAESDPDVRVGQVKEKWGSLRIYLDYPDEKPVLALAVRAARKESESTCEACGEPGDLAQLPPHWVKALCEVHLPDGAVYLPETT